jgi:hypothetical protein
VLPLPDELAPELELELELELLLDDDDELAPELELELELLLDDDEPELEDVLLELPLELPDDEEVEPPPPELLSDPPQPTNANEITMEAAIAPAKWVREL